MLYTCCFRDNIKMANVFPIFLNDDETSFCSHIPISLLSVISKVIEKVTYNEIYSFYNKLQLFNDNQYGFKFDH